MNISASCMVCALELSRIQWHQFSSRSRFHSTSLTTVCIILPHAAQISVQSPFTDFMETVGATSNFHMTMPDALKGRVRMPGVAGFGSRACDCFAQSCAYLLHAHVCFRVSLCSIFSGLVVAEWIELKLDRDAIGICTHENSPSELCVSSLVCLCGSRQSTCIAPPHCQLKTQWRKPIWPRTRRPRARWRWRGNPRRVAKARAPAVADRALQSDG